MSSLPTPVSPSMSTVTRVSTTLSSCSTSARIGAAVADDLLRPPLPPVRRDSSRPLRNAFSFLSRSSAARRRLHEARVGDRERGVVREHRAHVEVAAREDAGALAVVDLEDAEDLLAAARAARRASMRICAPIIDSVCADLARRVGGDDRGALAHHLAEDAARDGDGLASRGPCCPRTRVDDRDVAGDAPCPRPRRRRGGRPSRGSRRDERERARRRSRRAPRSDRPRAPMRFCAS